MTKIEDRKRIEEIVRKWKTSRFLDRNLSDRDVKTLVDAITAHASEVFQRGRADQAARDAKLCRDIADDHGGQYTDSGNGVRHGHSR